MQKSMPKTNKETTLLLDIGNTSFTWMEVLSDSGGEIAKGRAADFEGLGVSLSAPPSCVCLSCVRPAPYGEDYWSKRIRDVFNTRCKTVRLARPKAGCHGLKPAYANLSHLGTDRWLGLLALHVMSPPGNWLLIDAGTALSMDVLSGGMHPGGLLAPGKTGIRSAFLNRTGVVLDDRLKAGERELSKTLSKTFSKTGNTGALKKSRHADEKSDALFWGRETVSCLELGTDFMLLDFVLGRIRVFRGQFPDGRMMFTGGDGEELLHRAISLLSSAEAADCSYDSHLVCRGLRYAFD